MLQDKIYKFGKISIGLALLIIIAIGFLLHITSGNIAFMNHPISRRIMAILVFLLGAHMLCFNKRYAQDETARMEKVLSRKPKIIQLWLGLSTSYTYNHILIICIGIGAAIWGISFFIISFANP